MDDQREYGSNKNQTSVQIVLKVILIDHGCHYRIYNCEHNRENCCQVVETLRISKVFLFVNVEVGYEEHDCLDVEAKPDRSYTVFVGVNYDCKYKQTEKRLN